MARDLNVRSNRPALEELEDRAMPSVLLSGVFNPLLTNLQNLNSDLSAAKSDLALQVTTIKSLAPPTTFSITNEMTSTSAYAKATADLQRILTDQQAIKVNAGLYSTLVTATATAELGEGDFFDFFILNFGAFFGLGGLNPTSQFQTQVTNANSAVSDSVFQAAITSTTLVDNLGIPYNPIANNATPPAPPPFAF